MIVYIPIQKNREYYIKNGFDIEKDYNKIIGIAGLEIKCISGFLTDDILNGDYISLKIDIKEAENIYIANYDLWVAWTSTQQLSFNKMYLDSMIQFKKYIFGGYRIPEVIITKSVPPQQIVSQNIGFLKGIETKNDDIYLDNLIGKIMEDTNSINMVIVDYLEKLCQKRNDIIKKIIPRGNKKLYIFVQKDQLPWTIEV